MLADSDFRAVVYRKRTCPGGVVRQAAELERFRFCTEISGSLEIVNLTATDYSALHFIETVQGSLPLSSVLLPLNPLRPDLFRFLTQLQAAYGWRIHRWCRCPTSCA